MPLKIDVSSFLKGTNRALKQVDSAAVRAVDATADSIIKEAKRIVPVDTGKLKRSLKQETKRKASGAESVLGSDEDYALLVHEDLNLRHPNGQAKFLERPLIRSGDQLARELQKEFRSVK